MQKTQRTQARLSIDLSVEMRRRIRLAAARRDTSIRHYVLDAVQDRLKKDFSRKGEGDIIFALTAQADPVLAELWDNERDAAYDRL